MDKISPLHFVSVEMTLGLLSQYFICHFDWSEAEWRNLNSKEHLTTANGGASPQGEAKNTDRSLSTILKVT